MIVEYDVDPWSYSGYFIKKKNRYKNMGTTKEILIQYLNNTILDGWTV